MLVAVLLVAGLGVGAATVMQRVVRTSQVGGTAWKGFTRADNFIAAIIQQWSPRVDSESGSHR